MDSLNYLRGAQVNELPDISDAGVLEASDRACLDELREVLTRHNLAEKFGIALLHKHFELADDEVLLERCDVARRTLIATPVRVSEINPLQSVTTVWKFASDNKSQRECVKVCPMNGDKHAGYKDHQ